MLGIPRPRTADKCPKYTGQSPQGITKMSRVLRSRNAALEESVLSLQFEKGRIEKHANSAEKFFSFL